MDKQSFISYIKTLALRPEVEKAVLGYVETHEFGEKMVEDVAGILENAAEHSEMAADELENIISEMEDLQADLQEEADQYEITTSEADEKYANEVSELVDGEVAAMKQKVGSQGVSEPQTEQASVTPPAMETPPVMETAQTTPAPEQQQPSAPVEIPTPEEVTPTNPLVNYSAPVQSPTETTPEAPPPAPTM